MKQTSLEMVREFHEKFGHPIKSEPKLRDMEVVELRVNLIAEELNELRLAIILNDPTEALDALCDLQYVLDGAFLALGFAHVKDAAMAEVHRSNLSKLGADGKPVKRADGKILKGPNYTPPNLEQFL
jgi:predicted HAD superfamily Cof-like phosphohydrolase